MVSVEVDHYEDVAGEVPRRRQLRWCSCPAFERPRRHVVIFVEDLPTDISAAELGDAFHRLPESQARRDTILAAPAFRL